MTPIGPSSADAELATAVAAGDRKALAAIFDRYAPRLLAFCHSMLHNRADAEDCLQDIFILTATRVAGLREPERLRSWLFAIARHECLRRLDKRSREVLVEEIPERAPDHSDRPADAALDNELAALLRDAIAGLPDRDRLVLDLADRQGLGTDEVAAALSMSAGSAYKLLTRARATARKSIGALLVARTGRANCPDLDALLGNWNGSMTPLLRKRVARHIEDCKACQEQERRVASPAALLGAGTAFAMPIPIGLRSQILDMAHQASSGGVAAHAGSGSAPWDNGWPPASPGLSGSSGLRSNGSRVTGGSSRFGGPAIAVAAAVVALLVIGAIFAFRPRTTDSQAVPAPQAISSTSVSATGVSSSLPSGSLLPGGPGTTRAVVPSASPTIPTSPAATARTSRTAPLATTPRPTPPVTTPTNPTTPTSRPTTTSRRTTASAPTTKSSAPTTPTTNSPPPVDTSPQIDLMTVECMTYPDGTRTPVLTWSTSRTKGIELSVDNPDVVGSYGNYGPSGQLDLPPNGCDPAQGTQIYTIYAVGNDGTTAKRTINWDPPAPSNAPSTAATSTGKQQQKVPPATPATTATTTSTSPPPG